MGDWRACSFADGDDLVKWKFDDEEERRECVTEGTILGQGKMRLRARVTNCL